MLIETKDEKLLSENDLEPSSQIYFSITWICIL